MGYFPKGRLGGKHQHLPLLIPSTSMGVYCSIAYPTNSWKNLSTGCSLIVDAEIMLYADRWE